MEKFAVLGIDSIGIAPLKSRLHERRFAPTWIAAVLPFGISHHLAALKASNGHCVLHDHAMTQCDITTPVHHDLEHHPADNS
jgi:hypothetical protein